MTYALKSSPIQPGNAEGANSAAEELRRKRWNERLNFLDSVRTTAAKGFCDDDEYFRAVLDLSIDYGVSRKSLASLMGVSESAISRWCSGKNSPPNYVRPHIMDIVVKLLEATLAAEKDGAHLRELDPIADDERSVATK